MKLIHLTQILILFSASILAVNGKKISAEDEELIRTMLTYEDGEQFVQIYEENYDIVAGLDFDAVFSIIYGGKPTAKICQDCDSILKLAQILPDNPNSLKLLKALACKNFNETSPKLSERECDGLIDHLGSPVLYLLHNTKIPMEELCSVLMGHQCSGFLNRSYTQWTYWEMKIPEKLKKFEIAHINETEKNRKVLHLTDIHLDLFYTPDSTSKCNEPLCCRSTSYVINNKSHPAGHWGELDGDCDIPLDLVRDSIVKIHQQHPDIDMIFFTGDNVPHDIWNTSRENVIEHNRIVANLLRETFKGVAIFPVLGNHEAHPINLFVPSEVSKKSNFSSDWLYNVMADDIWSTWLTEEERVTFKKGGYYSRMINNGWKVIALNSNAGYRANFWRLYDPIDPDDHIQWLIDELDHAERNGVFVSILGHIPPSDMYEGWLHNYIQVFDRYSHIITGIYNGHTHNDELAIIYNKQNEPVVINYISGSLTTYSYLNPSYKIFEMSPRGEPLNFDVYFMDIDKANKFGQTKWLHEFNAIESYRLTNLTAKGWAKFIDNANNDLKLAYEYAEHYHRHSKLFPYVKKFTKNSIIKLVNNIKTYSPFQLDY